jgi:small GTP-binding protein
MTEALNKPKTLESAIADLKRYCTVEGLPHLATKASILEAKLTVGELNLAVLGQMKRGKSSLINALLNSNLLPVGVLPLTALITEIRYGAVPSLQVKYRGGATETSDPNRLAEFATEAGNPGNRKQVAELRLELPAALLQNRIVIVDTPGIGSTYIHNTGVTEGYLEKIDAALVVLSVDPPVTEVEIEFIRQANNDIPRLLFVLNKTDLVSEAELDSIKAFLVEQLLKLDIRQTQIYPLSAKDQRGIEVLLNELVRLASVGKNDVLVQSVGQDALRLVDVVKFADHVRGRVAALTPAELDAMRAAVDKLAWQTHKEIEAVAALLQREQARLVEELAAELANHSQDSLPALKKGLSAFFLQHRKERGRALGAMLEAFLGEEMKVTFYAWQLRKEESLKSELQRLSDMYAGRVRNELEKLVTSVSSILHVSAPNVKVDVRLNMESHLSFKTERMFESLEAFFLILPGTLQRRILRHRVGSNLRFELDRNAGRIRVDFQERLERTFADFQASLTQEFESLAALIQRALTADLSCAAQPQKAASLSWIEQAIRGSQETGSCRDTGNLLVGV